MEFDILGMFARVIPFCMEVIQEMVSPAFLKVYVYMFGIYMFFLFVMKPILAERASDKAKAKRKTSKNTSGNGD